MLRWRGLEVDTVHHRVTSDGTEISLRALEFKLRSIQEALELVVEVARDRRLLMLELAVVFLILLELIVSLPRLW